MKDTALRLSHVSAPVARVRSIAAALGFALLLGSTGAAEAANFAGTWTFTGTVVGPGTTFVTAPVCVLRQQGNSLNGSCKGPNAIGSAAGIVDANAITLQWHSISTNPAMHGRTGVATFQGVWGPDGIVRGKFSGTAFPGIGTFTGQKV